MTRKELRCYVERKEERERMKICDKRADIFVDEYIRIVGGLIKT